MYPFGHWDHLLRSRLLFFRWSRGCCLTLWVAGHEVLVVLEVGHDWTLIGEPVVKFMKMILTFFSKSKFKYFYIRRLNCMLGEPIPHFYHSCGDKCLPWPWLVLDLKLLAVSPCRYLSLPGPKQTNKKLEIRKGHGSKIQEVELWITLSFLQQSNE